jgi:hypothetical protein
VVVNLPSRHKATAPVGIKEGTKRLSLAALFSPKANPMAGLLKEADTCRVGLLCKLPGPVTVELQ